MANFCCEKKEEKRIINTSGSTLLLQINSWTIKILRMVLKWV